MRLFLWLFCAFLLKYERSKKENIIRLFNNLNHHLFKAG